LKNSYAHEVEKCENLSKELSICHDSISSLRTENASLVSKIEKLNVCNDSISSLRIENDKLNAKIEELNACKPSTSTIDHVIICTRCRDVNIEAMDDHLAKIKQQNDHIAKLTAKITEHELENENFKFARSLLYNGRCPGIKDGIGFQKGSQSNVKLNAPKRLSNFVKGKAPMVQDNEGYILFPANYPKHKIRKIHARKPHNVSHHAFIYKNEASISRHTTHIKMPKRKIPNASNEHNVSFKTFDASYVLTNKSGKVVAKYVGANTRVQRLVCWVPKVLVSNVNGPKTVWVPKNKA
jgi:prefoldin subunit 5